MNITFRQLRIFEAVARHESITRASEELKLTQPAVSMQIQQLEKNIDLPLFERHNRRLFLTSAGREVHHYTSQITYAIGNMEVAIEDLKGYKRGFLSVSVATTANHFAARLLGAFKEKHQDITIRLGVTNRAILLNQLENGEPDLAIMGEVPEDLELEAIPLMENPLVMIASPKHSLANRDYLTLDDIAKETFVVREQGSGTLNAIEHFFREHKRKFTSSIEIASNDAIKHAVEARLGLGIVSLHTIELDLETNRLVKLNVEDFPIMRHWYIVTRKGKCLSPIAKKFCEFLRQEATNYARFR